MRVRVCMRVCVCGFVHVCVCVCVCVCMFVYMYITTSYLSITFFLKCFFLNFEFFKTFLCKCSWLKKSKCNTIAMYAIR